MPTTVFCRNKPSLLLILAFASTSAACAATSPVAPVKQISAPAVTAPVVPPPPTPLELLTDRVVKVEQQVQGEGMVDLLMKLQALQEELQQLRGLHEEQANIIESLQQRQRDSYLDTDRRLSQLELEKASVQAHSQPAPAVIPPAGGQGVAASESPATPADTTAPAVAGTTTGSDPEQQAYSKAFGDLKEGRYPAAISGFQAYLTSYPNGRHTDNARYWLGEAYYISRDYPKAQQQFVRLADDSKSAKRADAMLKLGYTLAEQQQLTPARERLNQVVKEFPASPAASLAKKRLQELDKPAR